MDKSPHQLAKRNPTSSEEFRKFVNRLLYEDTSKTQLSTWYETTEKLNGCLSNIKILATSISSDNFNINWNEA